MMTSTRRTDVGAVMLAPVAALQWRLLLLWLVLLLLPTALAALPVWRTLAGLLDRSVHAADWARHFDALAFGDVVGKLGDSGAALHGSLLLANPDTDGTLRYAGRVGTGFSDRDLTAARKRLDAIVTDWPEEAGRLSHGAGAG